MSKEPKTAKQIILEQLEEYLRLHTREGDCPCEEHQTWVKGNAKEIYELCREQIRQQLIEEIEPHIINLITMLPNDEDVEEYESWWQEFRRGE